MNWKNKAGLIISQENYDQLSATDQATHTQTYEEVNFSDYSYLGDPTWDYFDKCETWAKEQEEQLNKNKN